MERVTFRDSSRSESVDETLMAPFAAASMETDFNPNECWMARAELFLTAILEGMGIGAFVLGLPVALEYKNPKYMFQGFLALFMSKATIQKISKKGWEPISTVAAYKHMKEKCGGRGKIKEKGKEPVPAKAPKTFPLPIPSPVSPEVALFSAGLALGALLLMRLSPALAVANSILTAPLQEFETEQKLF